MENSSREIPYIINDNAYRYDEFINDSTLHGKKKNHLPAMGWNSWNAFGSGNTEELTKIMADRIISLGLDKLGYKYLVLDDGCYLDKRVDGRLKNNPERFPNGFKALSDYIHDKGLKFGMYNDIGTNLCAGAEVGTCGFEREDAASYIEWGVDFLKVDNCYYLWDNATFSDARNAKYVFAPAISKIILKKDGEIIQSYSMSDLSAAMDSNSKKDTKIEEEGAIIKGEGAYFEKKDGVTYLLGLGTFDGTGPERTPLGDESAELWLKLDIQKSGEYSLIIEAECGEENGKGSYIEVCKGFSKETEIIFDGFFSGEEIKVNLKKGINVIRFMNHRRQENTLCSYAKLLEGLCEAEPCHNIIYSMCEWGKTQPQNWAKKVGDSWRILNDITFDVGSDQRNGSCDWEGDYTNNVMAQYDKCVIMDEFAGLLKGWNDPDMMVIGMDKLSNTQYKTHMTMWCMMNSPLMLGLDLRRVEKGDELYRIIANKELIELNQDPLGIQAKRLAAFIFEADCNDAKKDKASDKVKASCITLTDNADTEYIRNNNRVDILAKPLSDGSLAISFINTGSSKRVGEYSVSMDQILGKLGHKIPKDKRVLLENAESFLVKELWTGEEYMHCKREFAVEKLEAFDNVTIRIVPKR